MRVKKYIRNGLVGVGLSGVLTFYWRMRGLNVESMLEKDLEKRFTNIYQNGVWKLDDTQESVSGPGSSIHASSSIRQELPRLIERLSVGSLLDLGCGDYNWMSACDLPCRYIGADIVRPLIEQNRAKYGARAEFVCLDATKDPLPAVDAILCREVLFHLSFRDAKRAIDNVRRSSKYFFCTTDQTIQDNLDIPSGAWRDLNFELAPFFFPPPMEVIPDGLWKRESRVVGVWATSCLPPQT
jgi:SAM-dependent methyltransferase